MNNQEIDISIPTESSYAELYKDDIFIGCIKSEIQLFSIRAQIAEMDLEGYYIFWVDEEGISYTINITACGRLSDWPVGFFDLFDFYLDKLLMI